MDDIIKNMVTYGYAVLFIYSLGGGLLALLGAGVLSFMGKMDLTTSIAIAFFANVLGDSLLFYISRYHKSELMDNLAKHKRKIAFSHILMKRHGSWLIIVKKFIYGLKTLVPIAIGLSKYSFLKFSLFNVIGAFIWAVAIGFAGYIFGGAIITIYKSIFSSRLYIAPLALLSIAAAIWIYFSLATRKNKSRSFKALHKLENR